MKNSIFLIICSGVLAIGLGIIIHQDYQNREVDEREYSRLTCNAHSNSLKSYLKHAFEDGKITNRESKTFWEYWAAQNQDRINKENEEKRKKTLEKFKKELDDCEDCYEWHE